MKFIPKVTPAGRAPCVACEQPGAPNRCCYGDRDSLRRARLCNDALIEAGISAMGASFYCWAKAPEHSTLEEL